MTGAAMKLRAEDGMTLVEVLITCVLMLIVLGATLTSFNVFERNARTNELQNEAQEQTRRALELMARDLRNLASPTRGLPEAIDRAEPQDIIFQSEGKDKSLTSLNVQNTTRVRYCLNGTDGTLYRHIQTWEEADAPGVPGGACGAADGWASMIPVAFNVVNAGRPVFTYNAVEHDEITEVSSQLWVDTNPGHTPPEVTLQTSVFLRNQNRAPTAEFSWVPMPGNAIFLNASASQDPEEKALTFEWFDADRPPEDNPVGTGIVFTYPAPASGPREMYLKVTDATLPTESEVQTVCATTTGVTCTPTP
jgi:type II secretory pathway pseudopilin PulG